MVDLNLWRLEYGDTVLDFGTHESGHPFTRQVQVTPADLETDDMAHPLSDGIVFGRDKARGLKLGFVGAHLSTMPQPADRKWTRPMDDAGVFERAWKARELRRRPGAVASLANLDRGRMVYGRPRPYVADHERVRKGWLTYACDFVALDDRFYGTTEHAARVGLFPGELAAMTFPATFPVTGVAPSETRIYVDNAGTDDTYPVVTFNGGQDPRLELLDDAGGVAWALEVRAQLNTDQAVTVDCRPWARTVTRNGTVAPGIVRGSALEDATIPPGFSELRLTATDPTGTASAELRWRDAYAAL